MSNSCCSKGTKMTQSLSAPLTGAQTSAPGCHLGRQKRHQVKVTGAVRDGSGLTPSEEGQALNPRKLNQERFFGWVSQRQLETKTFFFGSYELALRTLFLAVSSFPSSGSQMLCPLLAPTSTPTSCGNLANSLTLRYEQRIRLNRQNSPWLFMVLLNTINLLNK